MNHEDDERGTQTHHVRSRQSVERTRNSSRASRFISDIPYSKSLNIVPLLKFYETPMWMPRKVVLRISSEIHPQNKISATPILQDTVKQSHQSATQVLPPVKNTGNPIVGVTPEAFVT